MIKTDIQKLAPGAIVELFELDLTPFGGEVLRFARGAFEAFNWTPPLATEPIRVVCREWSRSIDRHNLNTVTATFEQVFEP